MSKLRSFLQGYIVCSPKTVFCSIRPKNKIIEYVREDAAQNVYMGN